MLVEPWGIGAFTEAEEAGRRLAWTLLFYRERPDDNPYAKPIHGLHAIVDLDDMTVVRVEDLGVVSLPPGSGAYAADRVGPLRDDLKPLGIVQPQGPGFDMGGWEVRWQRWRVRLGFTAREGLVLHTIGYEDRGRVRPVIWRASVAELFIPYADPRPFQGWRNAFDIGEYGIGIMANSLELGCDCLGEIRYFDVNLVGERQAVHNPAGDLPTRGRFRPALEAFDAALHTTETRRSRRLVISFIITAGNYGYAIYWYFYPERQHRVRGEAHRHRLDQRAGSGRVQRIRDGGRAADPGRPSPASAQPPAGHGRGRLRNTVYEVDTEAIPPGPANPLGNAFRPVKRPLRRESEAQRVIDPLRGRHWLVANPGHRNGLGHEPAYTLVPGSNVLLFGPPEPR